MTEPKSPTLFRHFTRKHKGDRTSQLWIDTVASATELQEMVKDNVVKLCKERGISVHELFRRINGGGIAVNRTAFYKKEGERQKHLTLFHLVVFADALGVPVWLLFLPDIDAHFGPYR